MSKWIDVNDRTPNNGQKVIVLTDGEIDVATCRDYDDCMWEDSYGNPDMFVTHWQPLPLTLKEEADKEHINE